MPAEDLANLKLLLDTYFVFDAELFESLTGYTISVFILGLSIGLIVKLMVNSKL